MQENRANIGCIVFVYDSDFLPGGEILSPEGIESLNGIIEDLNFLTDSTSLKLVLGVLAVGMSKARIFSKQILERSKIAQAAENQQMVLVPVSVEINREPETQVETLKIINSFFEDAVPNENLGDYILMVYGGEAIQESKVHYC